MNRTDIVIGVAAIVPHNAHADKVANKAVDRTLQYYQKNAGIYSGLWLRLRSGQELYRLGNTREEFNWILRKNMRPVYDSAKRQGYEVWKVS